MNNRKPKLAWGAENFIEVGLVWAATLDDRFQLEVRRTGERSGELIVFDHQKEDKEIFAENVFLSYGAIFGADAGDVAMWQDLIADFVDNKYSD